MPWHVASSHFEDDDEGKGPGRESRVKTKKIPFTSTHQHLLVRLIWHTVDDTTTFPRAIDRLFKQDTTDPITSKTQVPWGPKEVLD